MSLKQQLTEDMKTAMRAKDAPRLGAIRFLQAAIKQKEVDERTEADDAAILSILDKLIKQRRDSISQFEQAGRTDLVDKERFELAVLQDYLPKQLDAAELQAEVDA
ncbi:MAG: GatB/YqeY domain-containing protein, partial [Betaproteobacteria bacterium]